MYTYLMCASLEGFYNVKESVIVVLTRHFDSYCNDDCLTGGWVIITVLGVWQVSSADVS